MARRFDKCPRVNAHFQVSCPACGRWSVVETSCFSWPPSFRPQKPMHAGRWVILHPYRLGAAFVLAGTAVGILVGLAYDNLGPFAAAGACGAVLLERIIPPALGLQVWRFSCPECANVMDLAADERRCFVIHQ